MAPFGKKKFFTIGKNLKIWFDPLCVILVASENLAPLFGNRPIFRRFVIPTMEIRLNKLNKLKLNKLIAMSE